MGWKLFGDDTGTLKEWAPPLLFFNERQKNKSNVEGKESWWNEKDVSRKGEAVCIQEDKKPMYFIRLCVKFQPTWFWIDFLRVNLPNMINFQMHQKPFRDRQQNRSRCERHGR